MAKLNNKVSLTELKKELKSFDQTTLISLIAELYKVNDENKQFLSAKFNGKDTIVELFDIYEKEITDEFFPDNGWGKLQLNKAKKAISTFKTLTDDKKLTLELMVHYVEMGAEFTNEFGDIDEKFYNSMGSMFEKVMQQCQQDEELFKQYDGRLLNIIGMAGHVGWGFKEDLLDSYDALKPVLSD